MIYRLMKRVLANGGYDKADMQIKLDTYFAFSRITKEQYEELSGVLCGDSTED